MRKKDAAIANKVRANISMSRESAHGWKVRGIGQFLRILRRMATKLPDWIVITKPSKIADMVCISKLKNSRSDESPEIWGFATDATINIRASLASFAQPYQQSDLRPFPRLLSEGPQSVQSLMIP